MSLLQILTWSKQERRDGWPYGMHEEYDKCIANVTLASKKKVGIYKGQVCVNGGCC